MARPIRATLSTANLVHNAKIINNLVAPAKVIAMIKSNAYGHGIRSTALRLDGHVAMFGAASIDEALIVHSLGIRTPILLAEGVFDASELAIAAEKGFHIVFHDHKQLDWLEAVCGASGFPYPIQAWLKVNTGMGRLGFAVSEVIRVYERLQAVTTVASIKIMSHFACADIEDHALTARQIDAFSEIKKSVFQKNSQTEFSVCNSAALFNHPELHYNYVRAGIALYGVSPFSDKTAGDLGLKPVMTFTTKVISVKKINKGDSIGYGARYICPEDMLVGVIACGYGDGYPLTARDGTPILINGIRCPLIGRVSMDMMTVDLRGNTNVQVEDPVVLWGEDLPLEEVVTHTSEIVWNMLTNIQLRVRFFWV